MTKPTKNYREELQSHGFLIITEEAITSLNQRVLVQSPEGYKAYKTLSNVRIEKGTKWFSYGFSEYNKAIFVNRNGCKFIKSRGNKIDDNITYIARCGHKKTSTFRNLYRRKMFDLCADCNKEKV